MSMIDSFKNNEYYELEANFNKLKKPIFLKCLKYLTDHYGLKQQNDTLDILNLSSKHRITIEGLEDIQNYCKTGTLTETAVQTIIQKDEIGRIFVPDFNYKVVLKNEFPIVVENRETYSKNLKGDAKIYRFKKRLSTVYEGIVRIDATIVKQSSKAFDIGQSDLFSVSEMYELEVEVIQKQLSSSEILNALLAFVSEMIQVIDGSHGTIIGNYERLDVLRGFIMLHDRRVDVSSITLQDIDGNPRRYFTGPQPMTLHKNNVIPPGIGITSILNNYTVTDKADGERGLIYIHSNAKVYAINSRMMVTYIGKSKAKFRNSLLDAEILYRENGSKMYVLCFDAYFIGGTAVFQLPLTFKDTNTKMDSRLGWLQKVIKAGFTDQKAVIKSKTFYQGDGDDMFNACRKILATAINNQMRFEDTSYKIDGLIFTPYHLGVGATSIRDVTRLNGTWNMQLKWKPEYENTIDFQVRDDGSTTSTDANGIPSKARVFSLLVGFDTQKERLTPIKFLKQQFKGTNEIANRVYTTKLFAPDNDTTISKMMVPIDATHMALCQNNDVIANNSVVECLWTGKGWVPLRTRPDKRFGNDLAIALDIWRTINNPVTEDHIVGKIKLTELDYIDNYNDKYYIKNVDRRRKASINMLEFHNWIKNKVLLKRFNGKANSLFDIACGKGGDLWKWKENGFETVLGIDLFDDNITNSSQGPEAGIYRRMLEKNNFLNRYMKYIFLCMDASKKLDPDTINSLDDIEMRQLAQILWGLQKPTDGLLLPLYSLAKNGFQVVSCQFAVHYFFKNRETLEAFAWNVNETLVPGGYFIGTCFDGETVARKLEHQPLRGSIIREIDRDVTAWAIRRDYDTFSYTNPESNIGKQITVYIDSINKQMPEFLVDFKLLQIVLKQYNIELMSQDDCIQLGLNQSTSLFEEVYDNVHKDNNKILDTSTLNPPINAVTNMTDVEKELSFMNRWFVFRKYESNHKQKKKMPTKPRRVAKK